MLFFITIPIGLFSVAAKVYGEGVGWLLVFGKFIVSLFIYLTFSVIVPILIVFLAFDSDSKFSSLGFKLTMQTVCLLAVAAYGFLGWLLCSLVNGKLIKSYSEFNLTDEKPQSLFPGNY